MVFTGESAKGSRCLQEDTHLFLIDSTCSPSLLHSVIEADGHLRKKYVGGWRGGLQHGNGTLFYDTTNTERYEGEWFEGQRSGWGRMTYADGSVYEGEFFNDQRCGRGLLLLRESHVSFQTAACQCRWKWWRCQCGGMFVYPGD